MAIYNGTGAANSITGSTKDDFIYGLGGNDTLKGGTGKDYIEGGADNDSVLGGADSDTLYGGCGNDRLFGESQADTLYGEDGDDYVNGGSHNDYVNGGAGADTLVGDSGDDCIIDDSGASTVDAGSGNDHVSTADEGDSILAGSGNDCVNAGGGNDNIVGDSGNDYVQGGAGNDCIEGNSGADTLYGDNGIDLSDSMGGANRVVNGSFELPELGDGSWSIYGSIPGWTSTTGGGIEVENNAVMPASEGEQLVELDSTSNSNMFQDVNTSGVLSNQFVLEFDYSPRTDTAGDNTIEVYWNGSLLDTLDGTGQGWSHHSYNVTGDIDGATMLEFRAAGTSNSYGGFIDDVSVTADPNAASGSDDCITGGTGNDYLSGGYGDDRLNGEGDAGGASFDGYTYNFSAGDVLNGGSGNDTFVFTNHQGFDEIQDFTIGEDVIELHGLGSDFATDVDPFLIQDGADTLVWFNADSVIKLDGVDSTLLSGSDFTFV
ncbi:MAG: hypothetical protein IT567_01400 [Alphaproteobacteria bacterium]|nr:hypothetical protein [Alphaproteobacteria bacterium]